MDFKQLENSLREALDIFSLGLFTVDTTKEGYQILLRSKNSSFFRLLEAAGFFQLHVTNKGYIVGLHQVSLYLHKGYKHMLKGRVYRKGEVEVHHLDHDKTNNSPSNLVYCSPDDNRIASEATRRILGFGFYGGRVDTPTPTQFNSNGDPIKDYDKWLANLIERTIEATLKAVVRTNRIAKHLVKGLKSLIRLVTNVYEYAAHRVRRIREETKWNSILRINWEEVYEISSRQWDYDRGYL